jgi:hypothetical protein
VKLGADRRTPLGEPRIVQTRGEHSCERERFVDEYAPQENGGRPHLLGARESWARKMTRFFVSYGDRATHLVTEHDADGELAHLAR